MNEHTKLKRYVTSGCKCDDCGDVYRRAPQRCKCGCTLFKVNQVPAGDEMPTPKEIVRTIHCNAYAYSAKKSGAWEICSANQVLGKGNTASQAWKKAVRSFTTERIKEAITKWREQNHE